MQSNPLRADAGFWFDTQSGNYSVHNHPPTTTHHHRSHSCLSCLQYDEHPCSISTKTAPICEKWLTLSPAPLFSFPSACLLHRWLAATNLFTSAAYLWVPHLCHENKSKEIKLENLSQQLVLWDLRHSWQNIFFQSELLLGMWDPGGLFALKSTI